jgi:16S rRNA (cytosine1402-N4)-methyltransferase
LQGEGFLLGVDRDEEAVVRARARLAPWKDRCAVVQGNFAQVGDIARERGLEEVDGVLLDIGVSSDQLEDAGRGFSFQKVGPLDMRMNRMDEQTAAGIVNTFPEAELCSLFRTFGEERRARQIARALVKRRAVIPFSTTDDLASAVEAAVGGRRGRLHPATKTFQALRIAVNGELAALEQGLTQALSLLRVGGRMAVISFHSLEDRIVKRFFAAHAGRDVSLPEGGSRWEGALPPVRLVNRKPVMASAEEQGQNPRSRSAKLRAAERIA